MDELPRARLRSLSLGGPWFGSGCSRKAISLALAAGPQTGKEFVAKLVCTDKGIAIVFPESGHAPESPDMVAARELLPSRDPLSIPWQRVTGLEFFVRPSAGPSPQCPLIDVCLEVALPIGPGLQSAASPPPICYSMLSFSAFAHELEHVRFFGHTAKRCWGAHHMGQEQPPKGGKQLQAPVTVELSEAGARRGLSALSCKKAFDMLAAGSESGSDFGITNAYIHHLHHLPWAARLCYSPRLRRFLQRVLPTVFLFLSLCSLVSALRTLYTELPAVREMFESYMTSLQTLLGPLGDWVAYLVAHAQTLVASVFLAGTFQRLMQLVSVAFGAFSRCGAAALTPLLPLLSLFRLLSGCLWRMGSCGGVCCNSRNCGSVRAVFTGLLSCCRGGILCSSNGCGGCARLRDCARVAGICSRCPCCGVLARVNVVQLASVAVGGCARWGSAVLAPLFSLFGLLRLCSGKLWGRVTLCCGGCDGLQECARVAGPCLRCSRLDAIGRGCTKIADVLCKPIAVRRHMVALKGFVSGLLMVKTHTHVAAKAILLQAASAELASAPDSSGAFTGQPAPPSKGEPDTSNVVKTTWTAVDAAPKKTPEGARPLIIMRQASVWLESPRQTDDIEGSAHTSSDGATNAPLGLADIATGVNARAHAGVSASTSNPVAVSRQQKRGKHR